MCHTAFSVRHTQHHCCMIPINGRNFHSQLSILSTFPVRHEIPFSMITMWSQDEHLLHTARCTYDVLTIVALQTTTLLPIYATPPFLATLSNIIPHRDGPTGDYYLVGPSSPERSTVGPRVLSHHLGSLISTLIQAFSSSTPNQLQP